MNRRTFLQRLVGGVVAASVACRLRLAEVGVDPVIVTPTSCIISDGLHIMQDTQDPEADYREWLAVVFKNQEVVKHSSMRMTRMSFKLDQQKQVNYHVGQWLSRDFPGEQVADSDRIIPHG